MTGGVSGEDFAGVPRTGRRLWTLRLRHRLADLADHHYHRMQHNRHPCDHWLCAQYDHVWLERVVHDADFRAQVTSGSEIDWAFEAKWSAADSLEIAEEQP